MVLRILRSANNLGSKAKLEGNDQSISKDPTIFENKYTCCFLRTNDLIWIDLTLFSVSTLFNSSILERPRWTVYIIFSNYIFFWFCSCNNFSVVYCILSFRRICYTIKFINCFSTTFRTSQPMRFVNI